jgi:hypothetical protein
MTNPTPPPELMQALSHQFHNGESLEATWARAFQAGADQELGACCEWLDRNNQWARVDIDELRDARRPKPQTLNSSALQMLETIEKMDVVIPEITDTIRRALEALPDDH